MAHMSLFHSWGVQMSEHRSYIGFRLRLRFLGSMLVKDRNRARLLLEQAYDILELPSWLKVIGRYMTAIRPRVRQSVLLLFLEDSANPTSEVFSLENLVGAAKEKEKSTRAVDAEQRDIVRVLRTVLRIVESMPEHTAFLSDFLIRYFWDVLSLSIAYRRGLLYSSTHCYERRYKALYDMEREADKNNKTLGDFLHSVRSKINLMGNKTR